MRRRHNIDDTPMCFFCSRMLIFVGHHYNDIVPCEFPAPIIDLSVVNIECSLNIYLPLDQFFDIPIQRQLYVFFSRCEGTSAIHRAMSRHVKCPFSIGWASLPRVGTQAYQRRILDTTRRLVYAR